MNERIKELLLKANLHVDTDEDENPEYRIKEELEFIQDGYGIDIEKFAELLVKECMSAVGDSPLERPAIQRIKARFGVEYYEPIEKAFE